MLAGAVDALERLLVQQHHESMPAGDGVHEVHHHLVLVVGEVALTVDRSELELVGRDFVVARLEWNTQPVTGNLELTHERCHARRDRTEIMVVQLLVLGGHVSHQGAPGNHEIRTGGVERLVHKEILLLPAEIAEYLPDLRVEHLANGQGRIGDGLEGLLERGLVVQGLSRI